MKNFPLAHRLATLLLLLLVASLTLNKAFAERDFLEPTKAFQFSSKQLSSDSVEVHFQIADGYYMYADRFKFKADGATLSAPKIPQGKVKFDKTFQKDMETFRNSVSIVIPIAAIDQSKSTFSLIVVSQGCSDEGLCYIPMESQHDFDTAFFTQQPASSTLNESESRLQSALNNGNLIVIIPLFLVLGLGLAFTPCVLPMVPILSSMIVGEGTPTNKRRGFVLSLSYSLGMALVYTALGVAVGLLGDGLAASLQKPWVLSLFGLLLVGFSLSMFDVYHFQAPAFIQAKLSQFSNRPRSGKILGVFAMGAISALIVGPCVAAPLASALLYIGKTRNVMVGGTALFSMAMGMSVPLLLVGLSAGMLLPRAGRWMESVKQFFGVLILGMALRLVSPVLPIAAQMVGWSLLLLGYGFFLFRHSALSLKVFALILCIFGAIEFVGVATGGRDILMPLAHFSGAPKTESVLFKRIKNNQELDQALVQASLEGKSVMFDFYADWRVACKEMERLTFTDIRVKEKLQQMVLLQVDVTQNTDEDKALLKRFGLFGPPGILFFGPDTKENGRVIGFENAEKFLKSIPISSMLIGLTQNCPSGLAPPQTVRLYGKAARGRWGGFA